MSTPWLDTRNVYHPAEDKAPPREPGYAGLVKRRRIAPAEGETLTPLGKRTLIFAAILLAFIIGVYTSPLWWYP